MIFNASSSRKIYNKNDLEKIVENLKIHSNEKQDRFLLYANTDKFVVM